MGLSQKRSLSEYLKDVRSNVLEEDFNNLNKRQRRILSRHKSTYPEWLIISRNLSRKYSSNIASQFVWITEGIVSGIRCTTCSSDAGLHGLFCGVICSDFNYTKCQKHLFTEKHLKRLTPQQRLWYVGFDKKLDDTDSFTMLKNEESELKAMVNLFSLCYLSTISNFALYTMEMVQKFILNQCSGIIYNGYSQRSEHKDMVLSLSEVQKASDKKALLSMATGQSGHGLGLAFDGNSKRYQPIKVYAVRGWKFGEGIQEKYLALVSNKKRISDNNTNLPDLLTTDTGMDNLKKCDYILKEFDLEWKYMNGLTADGAGQNMGENLGVISLAQVHRNRNILKTWGLIHRMDLVIGKGFKNIKAVIIHIEMVQLLYRQFHTQITSQVRTGIADLNDEKEGAIKKVDEDKWNYCIGPIRAINCNLNQILSTLRFLCNHDKVCIKWKVFKRDHPGEAQKKKAPEIVRLNKYWSDLSHIIMNWVLEIVCIGNEDALKGLSDNTLDIISGYNIIRCHRVYLRGIQSIGFEQSDNKLIKGFKETVKIRDIDDNKAVIRIGDFTWNVETGYLSRTFAVFTKKIASSLLTESILLFKEPIFNIMYDLKKLFDCYEFKHYETLEQAANHKEKELHRVVSYFSTKTDAIGREWKWMDLNYNIFNAQYQHLKQILFEHKEAVMKKLKIRIRFAAFAIECNPLMFGEISKLIMPLMTLYPSIITNESYFSYKEWFIGTRRVHQNIETLDASIRLKVNGPNLNDIEGMRGLCIKAAIHWNKKKNRRHRVKLLNLLSSANNKENTNNNATTHSMKKLLIENRPQLKELNEHQKEDVFHDAQLLSELIFTEKAIKKVHEYIHRNNNNHNY